MTEAVSALELCEQAEGCTATLGYVYDHHQDSDKADEVALLLASLRDVKQAVAEVYSAVEKHLLSMDTPKSFVVDGLGVVERKRGVSRKSWDNDGLRSWVIRYCNENGFDPLTVLDECARPSWRVQPLRALGVQIDEWCQEEFGTESIMLPARDLDERGESFRTDAA